MIDSAPEWEEEIFHDLTNRLPQGIPLDKARAQKLIGMLTLIN